MKKIKLFCFPYAGGSAANYKIWKSYLSSSIEVCPIELPGHGSRLDEPLRESIGEIVEDVFNLINRDIQNADFSFFGHSMGTVIAYELIVKIEHRFNRYPPHAFFSARFPPHLEERKKIHSLSAEDFKREILELGGTPQELIESQAFDKIFYPVLRADYKSLETYHFAQNNSQWEFDISVIAGSDDKETIDYNYCEWEQYTSGVCNFYVLQGGHFFLHNNTEQLAKIINTNLVCKN